VEPQLARWVAKLFAAYRTALTPRLLVLPGMLALLAAYNATAAPEDQLGLVEQGCLVGGFLSWKVRLSFQKVLAPRFARSVLCWHCGACCAARQACAVLCCAVLCCAVMVLCDAGTALLALCCAAVLAYCRARR